MPTYKPTHRSTLKDKSTYSETLTNRHNNKHAYTRTHYRMQADKHTHRTIQGHKLRPSGHTDTARQTETGTHTDTKQHHPNKHNNIQTYSSIQADIPLFPSRHLTLFLNYPTYKQATCLTDRPKQSPSECGVMNNDSEMAEMIMQHLSIHYEANHLRCYLEALFPVASSSFCCALIITGSLLRPNKHRHNRNCICSQCSSRLLG